MPIASRLYLISPVLAAVGDFPDRLKSALEAGDVACVLLRMPALDAIAAGKIVRACADIAQPRGAALLLEFGTGSGPTAALREITDGVHFARGQLSGAVEGARQRTPDAIVGVGGLKNRDDSMLAGESGADYLMFGEPASDGYVPDFSLTLERTRWWAEIFNVPCVAYAHRLPDVAALSEAGAEFIALGALVWEDPRGAAPAVAEAQKLLHVLPQL